MNIFSRTLKDREYLKAASSVAVPVTLQLVLSTVTNMVDTMMIGSLGTSTISAVGLANKFFYVFSLLIFGVHSGTGLLMAQFFGNHDHLHIRKTFGLGALINLTAALLFLSGALFLPGSIMHIFTDSAETTGIGIRYLRIVCFSYPLFAFSSLLVSMLRSTRNVQVPLRASIVSITANILLNYALIFGHFGFPALGVEGAAIATVAARAAELLILLKHAFFQNEVLPGKLSDFFGWTPAFRKSFSQHSLPVICNELIWGLGTTLYFVAYGHMGDQAVAAITISNTITDIIYTSGSGLSSAASVLLGNTLGSGNLEKADDYAKKLLASGILVSLAGAVLVCLLRVPLLSLYDVPEEVRSAAMRCVLVFALAMPSTFTNLIIIVGILRAGGDTKMCFLIDVSSVWLLAVPLAFLGALVWKLPIHLVYALVLSEEVFKSAVSFLRYRTGKWMRNLAEEV